MAADAHKSDAVLSLDGVVGGYGAMQILNGTTFDVRRGTITTIIGANGAGKSTSFKAAFGLLKLSAGKVILDGRDVTTWHPRERLQAGMCYVPQGRNIFAELTVHENLELGAAAASRGIDVAARIETAKTRFPMLRRKSSQQASTLSGGEQKLLEVARGLLLDPKLVLIDEPSVGLSPIMVQEIFTVLKELRAAGVTILMVEQNARSALEISDDGIVLELGRTRMTAPARALLDDPAIGQLFLGGHTVQDSASRS